MVHGQLDSAGPEVSSGPFVSQRGVGMHSFPCTAQGSANLTVPYAHPSKEPLLETNSSRMCGRLVRPPGVNALGVGDWPAWFRISFSTGAARPSCPCRGGIYGGMTSTRSGLADFPRVGRRTRLVWLRQRSPCLNPTCRVAEGRRVRQSTSISIPSHPRVPAVQVRGQAVGPTRFLPSALGWFRSRSSSDRRSVSPRI